MFNKEDIQQIVDLYPKRSKDLSESVGLINLILDELLNDINLDVSKALNQRNHDKATKCLELHSKICDIYDDNINLIESFETNEQEIEEQTYDEEKKVIPNYSAYIVDQSVPHTLYEDFEFKRPMGFKLKDYEKKTSTWIEVLVQTCEILYDIDSTIFKSFISDKNMNGKKKSYFSLATDNIRKPRKLNSVEVYIETNLSANSVKQLIIKMLKKYNIKIMEFIIYFRADYTELNK